MSKQVNYNENLCAGAAIRDDKGRRISKLFEAPHPKMTVGYAKNLIMPDTPTEQEFNFRQSGGGLIEDGVAVIDKVKGNSVVWNQLMKIHSKIDDGEIEQLNFTKGHKYLVFWKQDVDIPSSTRNTLRIDFLYFQRSVENNHPNAGYYNWMFTFEEDSGIHYLAWWVQDCPEGVTPSISNILFYDLTQMFGAGNEPTTYEEFLQRKPKVADEFAYNEGEIINNKVEKVVTTGRNLWDEEWETSQNEITSKNFNPIIPGASIYVKCPANSEIRLNWYDANKEYVSYNYTHNVESQVPANAHYFKILTYQYGTTYNHDVCINLSDPTINGKYFPYEKHELDLSWVKDIKDGEGVKLFEDGMKSAADICDETAKTKAVKHIGVVDLGDLAWDANETGENLFFRANIPNKHVPLTYNAPSRLVCSRYPTGEVTYYSNTKKDKVIYESASAKQSLCIYIKDLAYTSADQFKEAVKGVKVYFHLAEPIEVEYDEKNLTYPVVAGGTEEAIASEPSTAFRADIGYGIDAVKTILDLKARVKALEEK